MRASVLLAALLAAPAGASHIPDHVRNAATPARMERTMTRMPFVGEPFRRLKALGLASNFSPQQVHLSVTGDPTEMRVMWVTMQHVNTTAALFWSSNNATSTMSAPAVETSYSAGFGWSGRIYTATMTGLVPGAEYSYTVGGGVPSSAGSPYWSLVRSFRAAPVPSPDASAYIAVLADQGTIVPLGFAVQERVTTEHFQGPRPFDMMTLSGDIAYATLDPGQGIEVEWTWDAYQLQQEPVASGIPFMLTVGNHENIPGTFTSFGSNGAGTTSNTTFAAFQARYAMPGAESGGNGNIWYSFDFLNFHFTSVSSEHDLSPGSPQLTWVAQDLAKAAANRANVPWIILSMHRPILSSDLDEITSHVPGAPFTTQLGPLLQQFAVDLVLTGHEHCYERIHPTIAQTGAVVTLPDSTGTYASPAAPVFVVAGTSGAFQEETFQDPQPAWSAVRLNNVYGFGRLNITGAHLLEYTQVDTTGATVDYFAIRK